VSFVGFASYSLTLDNACSLGTAPHGGASIGRCQSR
jgi:hypothetical protein